MSVLIALFGQFGHVFCQRFVRPSLHTGRFVSLFVDRQTERSPTRPARPTPAQSRPPAWAMLAGPVGGQNKPTNQQTNKPTNQ
ncbi:unnamed protein product, partial [Protopolystoma xenopodis]